jgi:hypothetical protein
MCAGAKNVSFCTLQIATAAAVTATIITTTTKTTPLILLEKISLPE